MKMKIVFTHLKPEVWLYKTALALKRKGHNTKLISIYSVDRKMFGNAFDEIISPEIANLKPKSILKNLFKNPLNFFGFFYKLFSVRADVVICQGAPHYVTGFFIWLLRNRMKRIYFPYDFNFPKLSHPEKYFPVREIWGEKYSFLNCDGIIVKSDRKELELMNFFKNIKDKPFLKFPCYALSDWFSPYNKKQKLSFKDGETHVVYPGTVVFSPLVASMTLAFNKIVRQKIHLHLYSLNKLSENEIEEICGKNNEFKNYVHVHPPVKPYELSKEISKYDFGYHYSGHSNLVNPEAVKYDVGNKVASYLEAGIPIIVKEEQKVTSDFVKKHKIGIVVKDLDELRNKIGRIKYRSILNNTLKFRKKYSSDNNVHELEEFIKSLNN